MEKLTREAVEAAEDRTYVTFDTHLGRVTIQSLTEVERSTLDAYDLDESGVYSKAKAVLGRVRTVIASVVDEDTKEPLFKPSDLDWLKGKGSKFIATIYREALLLNGPDREDDDAGTLGN